MCTAWYSLLSHVLQWCENKTPLNNVFFLSEIFHLVSSCVSAKPSHQSAVVNEVSSRHHTGHAYLVTSHWHRIIESCFPWLNLSALSAKWIANKCMYHFFFLSFFEPSYISVIQVRFRCGDVSGIWRKAVVCCFVQQCHWRGHAYTVCRWRFLDLFLQLFDWSLTNA